MNERIAETDYDQAVLTLIRRRSTLTREIAVYRCQMQEAERLCERLLSRLRILSEQPGSLSLTPMEGWDSLLKMNEVMQNFQTAVKERSVVSRDLKELGVELV